VIIKKKQYSQKPLLTANTQQFNIIKYKIKLSWQDNGKHFQMNSKACKSFYFQAFLIFIHSNLYQLKPILELVKFCINQINNNFFLIFPDKRISWGFLIVKVDKNNILQNTL